MAPTYLVKVNGNDLTPYLKAPGGFAVERNQLQSSADRNMNGELKITTVGIFPKLLLNFRSTTQAEMSAIATLLDNFSFTVLWWDEKSDTAKSGTFYSSGLKVPLFRMDTMLYEETSVNLIPFKKMT